MREWGDSTDKSESIDIRCVDESCGWCGYTRAVQSYGCWSWAIEDCPWCLGPGGVEQGDWHRDEDDDNPQTLGDA